MTGFVIRTELYICVFVEVQAKEEGRAAGFGMHGTLQNASDLTWIMDSGSGDWILGKKRARGMARGVKKTGAACEDAESKPQFIVRAVSLSLRIQRKMQESHWLQFLD